MNSAATVCFPDLEHADLLHSHVQTNYSGHRWLSQGLYVPVLCVVGRVGAQETPHTQGQPPGYVTPWPRLGHCHLLQMKRLNAAGTHQQTHLASAGHVCAEFDLHPSLRMNSSVCRSHRDAAIESHGFVTPHRGLQHISQAGW